MKNNLKNYIKQIEKEIDKKQYTDLVINYSIQYYKNDLITFNRIIPYQITKGIINSIDRYLLTCGEVTFEHSIRLNGMMGATINIIIRREIK